MKKKIIIIIPIVIIILMCILISLLIITRKETTAIQPSISIQPETTEDIIKKYEAEYIGEENSKIYVKFNKDLYDEDGNSNENYFNNIINDLKPFYEKSSFYLEDEEKNITISVKYNSYEDTYTVLINNIENFFEKTNGKNYSKVDNIKNVKTTNINYVNDLMLILQYNTMYLDSIKDKLGEGKELDNGYTSYLNGTVKIRLAPTKAVRNIIFSEDYKSQDNKPIAKQFNLGMSLREVKETLPDNTFGSLEEGYLGYRNSSYYSFIYKDEISIYTYSYKYNKDFEDLLTDYLKTKDLDTFINTLVGRCKTYDYYEYDAEKQNAYVLFSNRGIEIDIKGNDPKGITLYNNYYFTEDTKQYVKDGLISLDSDTDLLDKTEKERRNNSSH